jgi:hypothetical protein
MMRLSELPDERALLLTSTFYVLQEDAKERTKSMEAPILSIFIPSPRAAAREEKAIKGAGGDENRSDYGHHI